MKLLDRYILSELRGPFFFGSAVFTIALVAGRILDLSRLMVSNGAPLLGIIRIVLLSLPGIMATSFPMAMLVAALLSFSRLSNDSEITAVKAGGIGLLRCLVPVLAMALLVSLSAIFITESIVPLANSEAEKTLALLSSGRGLDGEHYNILLQQRTGEGTGVARVIVYARAYDPQRQQLIHVSITEIDSKGEMISHTSAARAAWETSRWRLLDGRTKRKGPGNAIYSLSFRSQELKLKERPEDILLRQKRPEDMSIYELRSLVAMQEREGQKTAPLLTHIHLKMAIPFASLIFAVIGTPLGIRPQRSTSSVGFGISLIILFFYYVLVTVGLRMGQSGAMPPAVAAWMANCIIGLAGIALVVRAAGQSG